MPALSSPKYLFSINWFIALELSGFFSYLMERQYKAMVPRSSRSTFACSGLAFFGFGALVAMV